MEDLWNEVLQNDLLPVAPAVPLCTPRLLPAISTHTIRTVRTGVNLTPALLPMSTWHPMPVTLALILCLLTSSHVDCHARTYIVETTIKVVTAVYTTT